MKKICVSVIGGDMRQKALAKALSKNGFDICLYGIDISEDRFANIVKCASVGEAAERADAVILPLPACSGGIYINAPFAEKEITICETVDAMREGSLLLGGKMPADFISRAHEKGLTAADYYEREELTVMNAIPTAEGAIAIAMDELPITVHGMKAAVLGYGNVGSVLAAKLSALGADVTVFARKSSARAHAVSAGCHAADMARLAEYAGSFDCIFNTAPALIIDEAVLRAARRDLLIIDLASKPGGTDFEKASAIGIKAILALSLPGRVAPETAGGYIADTVMNIMRENNISGGKA